MYNYIKKNEMDMLHKIIGLTRDIEPKSERKEPQLIKSPDSISKKKKTKAQIDRRKDPITLMAFRLPYLCQLSTTLSHTRSIYFLFSKTESS
jgi:hypothetical protein